LWECAVLTFSALEAVARAAGFWPLRPAQVVAFTKLIEGHDLLVVWPTGHGKSLLFQLPGEARTSAGLTLVVSPLIALMEDQVAKGKALGWSVTCLHSRLHRDERARRLRAVAAGEVRLLYVTPERFRQEEFFSVVRSVGVSLLAIDEAHCISQWGHDFRPDYSRLGRVREQLGRPQVMALTATATREVQLDIRQQLGCGPDMWMSWEGVERPNLWLSGEEFEHADDKFPRLLEWLRSVEGPRVVYFTLISSLVAVADRLRGAVGIGAFEVYHGDLEGRDRLRAQTRFLSGDVDLILATPAFGLGVDKPNIRGVLHYEVPGSLEAYFQEVGRAGRDGLPSQCGLLYCQSDLLTQMGFVDSLTPDPIFIRAVYELLVRWRDRLKSLSLDDLRAQLSFKNKRDYRLETALSFLDRWEVIRFAHRRLDQLEILRELTEEDLSAELWEARRQQLQRKLLSVVQWFRSEECRKVGVYRYFGWDGSIVHCGFCDRCDEAGVGSGVGGGSGKGAGK